MAGGTQSLLDENLYVWKNNQGDLEALATTHVDDIAAAGTPKFLKETYSYLTSKFGKVTIISDGGYKMDQQEFLDSMKDMDRALTVEETSLLPSILGGLLWVTATRLDLVADVGVLQSGVTKAKVSNLVLANSIIKKAKMQQYRDVGIIYRHFPTTVPWKVAVTHDASSASKSRSYSHEGVIVLLMPLDTFSTPKDRDQNQSHTQHRMQKQLLRSVVWRFLLWFQSDSARSWPRSRSLHCRHLLQLKNVAATSCLWTSTQTTETSMSSPPVCRTSRRTSLSESTSFAIEKLVWLGD